MFTKMTVRGSKVGLAVVLMLLVVGSQLGTPEKAYCNGVSVPEVLGKTYGEWSALWWQWALQAPAATNPLTDPDGTKGASYNQTGNVWFLAGNWTGTSTITRNVTITKGQYLFLPLVNGFAGNNPDNYNAAQTPPLERHDEAYWRAGVFDFINYFGTGMHCTLDGVEAVLDPDTPIVRSQSPAFSFILPEDNLFGLDKKYTGPTEVYDTNVSDGYWVMLPPLSEGMHVLNATVPETIVPNDGNPVGSGTFSGDLTWNITVDAAAAPVPPTVLLLGSGLLGLVGYGRRRSV